MKEYNAPELKIVSFHTESIITASGPIEPKSSIAIPGGGGIVEATQLESVKYNTLFD